MSLELGQTKIVVYHFHYVIAFLIGLALCCYTLPRCVSVRTYDKNSPQLRDKQR